MCIPFRIVAITAFVFACSALALAQTFTTLANFGGGNCAGLSRWESCSKARTAQTFGAACTPVIGTAFPLAVSDLVPAQTGTANLTIDFTGCAAAARFTAQFTYSANAGTVTGNVVRYNQYE
jgi:hypothetical protein